MDQKPTTDETFESQSVAPRTVTDNTEMAEEAKSIPRTAKAMFTRMRNELLNPMDADQEREIVEGNYVKLSEAWDIVKSKHDPYTMYLTDKELEVAERWITELRDLFSEATACKIQYTQK